MKSLLFLVLRRAYEIGSDCSLGFYYLVNCKILPKLDDLGRGDARHLVRSDFDSIRGYSRLSKKNIDQI